MPPLLTSPPDDPVPTAAQWLAAAAALGRRNANAVALATADTTGRPSVRMVLLKELAPAGYGVFYTHYGSRKAADLSATRRAAAVLYWHELGRQIRFEGVVVRSPPAESDAYFATRPWRSQLNAWSSEQSRPLDDPTELERRAATIAAERGVAAAGAAQRLPRPDFWGGYRVWFEAVELWVEGQDRFHERLRYERRLTRRDEHSFDAGHWLTQRLQP
ncbi:MAG TPA: pyridoxamine 5'-phosphate oxidase [Gammaproteobacteria bacterium]|nr:pyridoxamine 5'-phosphate oxidase [Gammaproteobacteria bacterium]